MTTYSTDTTESKDLGSVVYRYEPRPHTIYLNITNRCTNNCSFCVKNYSSGLSGYRLRLEREPSIDEVWRNFQDEVNESDEEAVWCGFGEPTLRLNVVLEVTRRIRSKYPLLKIRLNTDGLAQLVNQDRDVPRELERAGISMISISLNAESKEKYDAICRPSLRGAYDAVLSFAKECREYLPQVTLTVLESEGIDISECRKIAEKLGCEFKVR